MRLALPFTAMLLAGLTLTSGQVTAPRDSGMPWEQTVQALSISLTDASETGSLTDILPAGTSIRRFDKLEPEDRLSLRQTVVGAAVVAAMGYRSTPTALVSDLTVHLRAAEFVPGAIRDSLIPKNDRDVRQANETAAKWISTTLQPGVEQPVGVIVLWQYRATDENSGAGDGELIFILLKAQQHSGSQYRISQLLYGNTRQIVR